jgi:uncharacterized membrane protein
MSIGPVEYIVVGFPGNEFTGEIAPAIADLVESGTIRIHDLVFITKDANGDFGAVEFDEHDGLSAFASIDGEIGGVIGNDDIEHAAEALEPGSSAALLVWEDLWARPLLDAFVDANAVLLEGGRIPHDLIEPVLAGLES